MALSEFSRAFDEYLEKWGFRCSGELMLTVPSFQENPGALVDILKTYCNHRSISLETISFQIAPSQQYLPSYDGGPLDLVLIDGCHSFPSPFIDWYYTEKHLAIGGVLVIDDVHIWTGDTLRRFLKADTCWKHVRDIPPRTSAFRKIKNGSSDAAWDGQPFVRSRSRVGALSQGIQHLRFRASDMIKQLTSKESK
jgi:hypothetical protein